MAFCTKCGSPVEGAFCVKCGTRLGEDVGQSAAPGSQGPIVIPPESTAAAGPPPGSPGVPPKKKGKTLLWVLVGCGGLIVIAGVLAVSTGLFVAYKAKQAGFDPALIEKNPALAVAKIIASVNPEIEVLGVDEDRGVIRVREKKTGKTLTVNLEDAKNGKFVFYDENNEKVEIQAQGSGDSGSLEIRGRDSTVKIGGAAEKLPDWLPAYPGAVSAGMFSGTSGGESTASYTFKTQDAPEKVAEFYERALNAAGFELEKHSASVPGQGGMVGLSGKKGDQSVIVNVIGSADGTMINLTSGTVPDKQ